MTNARLLDDSLSSATCAVLENLAFLFAEPNDESAQDRSLTDAADFLTETIRFAGDRVGRLEVRLTLPLAKLLAANMLGSDAADSMEEQEARDAAGELANIICGNVLPALGAGSGTYHLQLQDDASDTDVASSVANDSLIGVVSLAVERSHLEVRLYVEPAVTSADASSGA